MLNLTITRASAFELANVKKPATIVSITKWFILKYISNLKCLRFAVL